MRDVRGHFENLFREIIDAIEEAASARDENTSAEVIDERFFIEPSFEQLKSFAEAKRTFANLKIVPNISPRILKLWSLYGETVGR